MRCPRTCARLQTQSLWWPKARRAVHARAGFIRLEAAEASEMADIADATGLFKVPAIHWGHAI